MDINLEMLAEVLIAIKKVSAFTDKVPDIRTKPLRRLQWAFQRPKITMLRAAIDVSRSNINLLIGALQITQKAVLDPITVPSVEVINEDERDRSRLESLQLAQQASLKRLQIIELEKPLDSEADVDFSSKQSTQVEAPDDDLGLSRDTQVLLSTIDVSELQDEIGSLLSRSGSRTYSTDIESIRSRISRSSNRFSQLLQDDQIKRISQRWSQTLTESRPNSHQDSMPSFTGIAETHETSSKDQVHINEQYHTDLMAKYWLRQPQVKEFCHWMQKIPEPERRLVLDQLPVMIAGLSGTPNLNPVSPTKSPQSGPLTATENTFMGWVPEGMPASAFNAPLPPLKPRPNNKPFSAQHIRAASTGVIQDRNRARYAELSPYNTALEFKSAPLGRLPIAQMKQPQKTYLNPKWFPYENPSTNSGVATYQNSISGRSPGDPNSQRREFGENTHILPSENANSLPRDELVTSWVREAIIAARAKSRRAEDIQSTGPNRGLSLELIRRDIVRIPEEAITLMKFEVERLALSRNHITLCPQGLADCSRLRYLNLQNNEIKVFPKPILQLKSLEILDLANNKIEVLPETIDDELQSLKVLKISENRIVRLPLSLGQLENLEWLWFDNNPLIFPTADVYTLGADSNTKEKRRIITWKVKDFLCTYRSQHYLDINPSWMDPTAEAVGF